MMETCSVCVYNIYYNNNNATNTMKASNTLMHFTGSSSVCSLCTDFGTKWLWQEPQLQVLISNCEKVKGKKICL